MKTERTAGKRPRLPIAVFIGSAAGLLLILLLTLAVSVLVWTGVIPPGIPSSVLILPAFLGAFTGGRIAIRRSASGTLTAGGLTGAVLCALWAAVQAGNRSGHPALSGSWLTTMALILAGGVLAGLMGRKTKGR